VDGLSSNPFSTRFTAPGQVDWIGPSDFFDVLCKRWQASNYRAAILGAHGSGKSTLLEHFVPMVAEVVWRRDALGCCTVDGDEVGGEGVGCEVEQAIQTTVGERQGFGSSATQCAYWLQLRKSEPQSMVVPWGKLSSASLLVLDGYEQLNFWRRAIVLWRTKKIKTGLLVTSHRRTRLPTLCELSVSVVTARAVIERLTAKFDEGVQIKDTVLQQRLEQRGGNLRDVLMDLYDEVEQRRLGRKRGW